MTEHPFQIKEKDNTQLHDVQLLQKQLEIMSKNYELAQKQEEDRQHAKKTLGFILLFVGGAYLLTVVTLSTLDYMDML